MARSGKLELGDENGVRKKTGYHLSTGQLVLLIIVLIILIVGVGLLAYFLPKRWSTCALTSTGGSADEEEGDRATSFASTPPAGDGEWNGRLPRNLVPEMYEIYIKPFLYEEDLGINDSIFTFNGSVTIQMVCKNSTDTITIHSKNINITNYRLTDRTTGGAMLVVDFWYEIDYDFVHFRVGTALEVDNGYELQIDYVGALADDGVGIYRGSYEERGVEKWFAASQMQATHARRALPCFDEPDFKAAFNTRIEHRSDMVALTNGIEVDETGGDNGWTITEYKETPVMSVYLLAFAVGYFNYTERYSDNNVRYRVWSRPEKIEATRYALDIVVDMTTYFESYFNITFDLPKQDMIATTHGSAMENWGLIIYEESYLLFDVKMDTVSDKQAVNTVVAHEIAHQWFGNLITCQWWEDLWLNEGFASYLETLATDHTEPTWSIHEQVPSSWLVLLAFSDDSLGTSHPMRRQVNTTDGIFDAITYYKGAMILRMLNNILGEKVFAKGLRLLLNRHLFGSIVTDDLWRALTQADEGVGNRDVKAIMDTWTLQMGYPVVNIRRVNDYQLNASQEHFLLYPDDQVDDKYGDLGYLWYIYLTFTQKMDANFDTPHSVWINKTQWDVIQLPSRLGNGDWYLANIKQYGYFRVNYDDENWSRLAQQLLNDHSILPVENRAGLFSDAFALARAGLVGYPFALNMTLYLRKETDYVAWECATEVLNLISEMLSKHSAYGHLERYMRHQVNALYEKVGWEDDPLNDSHMLQLKRVSAIKTACKYQNQDCLRAAVRLFHQYMVKDANNTENKTDPEINPITPNLRRVFYCYAIQEGGQRQWDFGWKKLQRTSELGPERSFWLYALSCSKRPWILNRYLDKAHLNSSHLQKHHSSRIVRHVSENPVGKAIAWEFIRNRWNSLVEFYGDESSAFQLVGDISANFNTKLELHEVTTFAEEIQFSDTERLQEVTEKIQKNIAWMEAYEPTVSKWLEWAAHVTEEVNTTI